MLNLNTIAAVINNKGNYLEVTTKDPRQSGYDKNVILFVGTMNK